MTEIKGGLNRKGKEIPRNWYIWYTQPRVEKKLKTRLENEDIEVFLPMKKELRQWSDRKKWVEMPLFNGYIFTKISPRRFDEVRRTDGIVTFLKFDGKPAFLREEEIERIQKLIMDPSRLEVVHYNFEEGEKVEIMAGPLMGVEGLVIEHKGNWKVAINIEKLGQSVLVNVPINYLRKKGSVVSS